MSLIVDLDPELGISAEKFVAAWNAHPTASKIATAAEDDAPPTTFESVTVAVVLAAFATGMVTMSLDVLKTQINAVLKEMREGKKPAGENMFIPDNAKIERIRNHDGSEIITVTIPPIPK